MRNYKIEKDFVIHNYRCVVVGQSLGHRCGYVGVSKGHFIYGKDYDELDIEVHGCLTYAGDGDGIYPVDSDLWWIGFDCGHYGDSKDFNLIKELASEKECEMMIKMEKMFSTQQYGTVKTLDYVVAELVNIVEQLMKME